jgi:protoheme IX farnesyltransferase
MWYDRDIDGVMERTRSRPIPAGRIPPEESIAFGVVLSLAATMLMGLALNWLAAGLLALAIAFYVVVYTIWLKRRTPQNIVIGGAAGAFPPMIGWAAATGDVGLGAAVMFAIVFMWTPPHFWALALYREGDYAKAGVPMLPVVAGPAATKTQMLIYTLLLLPLAPLPTALGLAGWVYGGAALLLGFVFAGFAWQVRRGPGEDGARPMFAFSILYLFLLFALLIADRAPGLAGGPWS